MAVIPTRDRPEDWADCVAAIAPQVELVVTVAHVQGEGDGDHYAADRISNPNNTGWLTFWAGDQPNISRMWNLGIETAEKVLGNSEFLCAILNDDAIVPEGWFDRLARPMSEFRFSGASGPRGTGGQALTKIAGWAFVLNAGHGIRADEDLQWWYGDDDIQMQCEQAGGFYIAKELEVEHRHPHKATRDSHALKAQSERDMVTFATKWRGTK